MKNTGRKIVFGILTVVASVILLALFFGVRNNGISPMRYHLDSGWSLTFNGNTSQIPSLSEYKLPRKIVAGDTLTFERILSDTLCLHPVLRFRTYHSVVAVEAGEERVYSFGDDYHGDGFVGSGFHYAFLNRKALGKKLTVTIIPQEKDAFAVMPDFDVLPENGAITDYNANHMLTIIVGVFLVLFGILSVLATLVLGFSGMVHLHFLMIGLLSLLLGLWSLCYMMVLQIFSADFAFNTTIEYLTLYLAPLPLCAFLLNMRQRSIGRKRALGIKILFAVDLVFLAVASLLHWLNIVHYTACLWIFHLYILASFAYLGSFVVELRKKSELSGKLLSWGVFFFVIIAVMDLVRYNVYRAFLYNVSFLSETWIPLGILVFVLFLLASYLVSLHKIITDKAEKDVLAAMVYVDSLTGLFNRAKCQQIFDILDKVTADYAVISIDMNGLKFVNDRYGHGMGDELLKAFADVFKVAFTGVGTTIRMGGDEFVAIVRSEHLCDVEAALQRMETLQKASAVELPIPLEVAYGVACRSECGDGPVLADHVYHLADERMYAQKASMKSDLVRH